MKAKMHRRRFLKGSLGVLAAGQGAGLLPPEPAAAAVQQAAPQPGNAEAGPAAARAAMFPGFREMRIETSGAAIQTAAGGSGPAVLLLHGFPQTHVMWHKVAPRLAEHYSVVAPDLRGYGDSSTPPDGQNHVAYSKRAMGQDMAEVMTRLGFERFAVMGHDRGARVATRMALDYPDRVTKLAVLDNLPTRTMYRNVTKEFATQYYHWFFRIQPAPFPETLIQNSVEFYIGTSFNRAPRGTITDAARAEYLRCYSNPAVIHASCEDYRAGAGVDLEIDEADWAKKITCPVLLLWAQRGNLERFFGDPLAVWKEKALDVRGKRMPTGHYVAEEAPDETLAEFRAFLAA